MLGSASLTAFVTISDREAARAFYEDVLGLALVDESPFAIVFDANGTTLRVAISAAAEPAPYTVVGWTVADIRTDLRRLAELGVEIKRYDGLAQDDDGIWTTPGGDQVGWFNDPHGNVLSLTQFG